MNRGRTADEEFARRQQELLYAENSDDSDEDTSAVINAQLDMDAAVAQRMQAEEYSRASPTRPSHPYFSSKEHYSDHSADEGERPAVSDAELAAHLQAEENQKQRRAVRRQRPPNAQASATGTQPRPSNPQSPSNNGIHPVVNILSTLLQSFAFPQNTASGIRFPLARGVNNLQNTPDDFGPEHYEQLLQLDEAAQQANLSEEQISTLPTERFRPTPNQTDDEKKCAICMEQFEADEPLRRLTCFHVYHVTCIDRWLKKSNLCPICRVKPIK